MTSDRHFKTAVCIAEMARMVGLSRARFYQLQRSGAFPSPQYDPTTRRPFFDEAQQRQCLDVRHQNRGINGKPVLFYAPRVREVARALPRRSRSKPAGDTATHEALVESLAALGAQTTSANVSSALGIVFPHGTARVTEAEVIRQIFLHLRRQNSADNVGR